MRLSSNHLFWGWGTLKALLAAKFLFNDDQSSVVLMIYVLVPFVPCYQSRAVLFFTF